MTIRLFARQLVTWRLGVLAAGLLLPLLGSGCEREYPLEPTFCDYWCRATLRAGCGENASSCVRDCELTKASSTCFSLQEQLLTCYEEAEDEQFVCAQSGFSNENRVTDGVCQSERDALFECEAPGIGGSCLTPCRLIQAELNQAPATPPEVEAGAACPLLAESCEAWCWTLFSFSSEQLAALGIPASTVGSTPGLPFAMPSDSDAGLSDGGAGAVNPLASCVELLTPE